jgi:ComF family protein
MDAGVSRTDSAVARLGRSLDSLLGWAFPTCCPVCGAPTDMEQLPWCDACAPRIVLWDRPLCPECRRFRSSGTGDCTGGHANVTPAVVTALGPYDDALGAVVRALKYDGLRAVAAPLGRLMAARLLTDRKFDAVVSVPTAAHKRRERGFGHAELIAANVARTLEVPFLDRALRLTRRIADQTRLSPARRRANVRGAFALKEGLDPAGRCILLVDDVMTTGATLQEGARVLAAAHAASVHGAVVALNVGAADAHPV